VCSLVAHKSRDNEQTASTRTDRDAALKIFVFANGLIHSAPESATHIAWVKSLWDRLESHLPGRAYVNHLASDDRPEKVRSSFGQNYDRLRLVKRVYDPTNLFRLNANIAP
jgi:FAD/FMN-containing dehydrogenase